MSVAEGEGVLLRGSEVLKSNLRSSSLVWVLEDTQSCSRATQCAVQCALVNVARDPTGAECGFKTEYALGATFRDARGVFQLNGNKNAVRIQREYRAAYRLHVHAALCLQSWYYRELAALPDLQGYLV